MKAATIIAFLAAALAFAACHQPRRLAPAPETIFDDRGLHIITSFHNERTGTISVLYGNDEAVAHAAADSAAHAPGEVYKLVTWDLKQNPLWFGGSINGGLQSVETVTVKTGGTAQPVADYTLEKTEQKGAENAAGRDSERISFIFAQRASVFP
ncbi:hypothetical protein GCM10010967_30810 [Dyadobacter beijingensis]|uniref:Uncharacterized protein n=1 Tax=Dyadobacter beijingensis TaxID=365489 RepID=A0ABQ2I2D7_9BACT|nr:hypothetical protein [Dyadobacter beijingensis]GGM95224.1 hypothetical protein GCM10010967_30810 [Dyadobacter beijingensis]